MSGVWVVIEERAGRIARISWEAVAAAQKLASQFNVQTNAILIGSQTEAFAAETATKGLAKVVRIEHPFLAQYTSDGFSHALEQFIHAESPDFVVFPHTYQVRDYAPALAARLNKVLIGDVTAIGDGPVFTRQLLQGRLTGNYRASGTGPCFISVQSGAFRAETAAAAPAAVSTFAP